MCFNQNQTRDISTLTGGSLKVVDKSTYLGSSVSSTENDINTRLEKAWSPINRLSVIWKSDLSDKIKRIFSNQWLCAYYYMDAPHGRWLSVWRKSLTAVAQKMLRAMLNKFWKQHPTKQQLSGHQFPSLKPFKSDKQDMQDTAGEVRANS